MEKRYDDNINRKNFYDQSIDCDMKRYKKIRKVATVQVEDYTRGRLLYIEIYIN